MEKIVHRICATKRQVNKVLAKNGLYMKYGMLWKLSNGTRVHGYVERLQSGKYTVFARVQ